MISACHISCQVAGDRGSTPRQRVPVRDVLFEFMSLSIAQTPHIFFHIFFHQIDLSLLERVQKLEFFWSFLSSFWRGVRLRGIRQERGLQATRLGQ
jgi:hypothetical protein